MVARVLFCEAVVDFGHFRAKARYKPPSRVTQNHVMLALMVQNVVVVHGHAFASQAISSRPAVRFVSGVCVYIYIYSVKYIPELARLIAIGLRPDRKFDPTRFGGCVHTHTRTQIHKYKYTHS